MENSSAEARDSPLVTSYVDPYLNPDFSAHLQYNHYETYVRPLQENNPLHKDIETVDQLDTSLQPRRSPVHTLGLETISTSRVEEPSQDPEEIKRQREMEERMFAVPRATPASMEPISVSNENKESDDLVKKLKSLRDSDLLSLTPKDPPPEAIHCGWREYQGGANWKDITKYRDYELGQLRDEQRQQQRRQQQLYYYY